MIKRFLLASLLLFTQVTYADSSDLNKFTQRLGSFNSMKANFKQVISDEKSKVISQSSGSMALKRPGMFRWYTHLPNRQLIVVNGDKMWVYDIDLEQLTINHLNQQDESIPAMLLSDKAPDINKTFSVTMEKANKKQDEWFKLTPKSETENLVWVKFYFDQSRLKGMAFKDKLDQTTKITFKNIRVDKPLKADIFKVKPANGVDVIDNYQPARPET